MDSKGVEFPGLTHQFPLQPVPERRTVVAIKPVEKTNASVLRSSLHKPGQQVFPKPGSKSASSEEQARYAAKLLSKEIKDSEELEVDWTLDKNSGTLVVEIKDRNTGEVLRQIPPEDILQGTNIDPSGLLLNTKA